MKRIFFIAAITAAFVLFAAGFLYFRQRTEGPAVSGPTPPVIDVATLKSKAAQGDAQAQARLGKAFADGVGIPRDVKQSAHWYGIAATNGNIDAETMIGELYQAGQGVPRDLTNAAQWYSKAAQGGSAAAQYDLAFMYEQGLGGRHDAKLAAHWYQLAAEGGDALAQFDYGQRCVLGVGVAQDPVEGLKWLLLAGAQGQKDADAKAESVRKGLSSAQIAEAKHRAAVFTPRANP